MQIVHLLRCEGLSGSLVHGATLPLTEHLWGQVRRLLGMCPHSTDLRLALTWTQWQDLRFYMQNVTKLHSLSWGNVLSFHAQVLTTLSATKISSSSVRSCLSMIHIYRGVVCWIVLSPSLQVLWIYNSGTLVRSRNVIVVFLVKTTCLDKVLPNLKLFQI